MEKDALEYKRKLASEWFKKLRDLICAEFELIENEFALKNSVEAGKFRFNKWDRKGGGGGISGSMKGNVFEKVGVNISTVSGEFSEEMQKNIPGAQEDPKFWASGISLVAHMKNPKVPSIHMNTRFINTTKEWFGGGIDLTPCIDDLEVENYFHNSLQESCEKFAHIDYQKYKKWCDEYFFIKHRKVTRGIGGIFYDYLDSSSADEDGFEKDFLFTQEVGKSFLEIFPKIVREKMFLEYGEEDKDKQLYKRGLYVEFNLLYDRGTKFGLMTDGNVDAILMSLPPLAKW